MAVKKVELNELTSQNPDAYDILIPNCIYDNSTGTPLSRGLSIDSSGVLKFNNNVVPYKKPIVTNANFSGTPTSEAQFFDITLTNIQLEHLKHYQAIGVFNESGNLRTKVVYDFYPDALGVAVVYYASNLTSVICKRAGENSHWHDTFILSSVAGGNTTLNIGLASTDANIPKWAIDSFNTLKITDIYEIIE